MGPSQTSLTPQCSKHFHIPASSDLHRALGAGIFSLQINSKWQKQVNPDSTLAVKELRHIP